MSVEKDSVNNVKAAGNNSWLGDLARTLQINGMINRKKRKGGNRGSGGNNSGEGFDYDKHIKLMDAAAAHANDFAEKNVDRTLRLHEGFGGVNGNVSQLIANHGGGAHSVTFRAPHPQSRGKQQAKPGGVGSTVESAAAPAAKPKAPTTGAINRQNKAASTYVTSSKAKLAPEVKSQNTAARSYVTPVAPAGE